MHHPPRTTFSPSPRVAKAIREIARQQGKSISSVVDELLQSALDQKSPRTESTEVFRVTPTPLGLRPGLDPTRLRDLLSDLEVNGL